MRTAATLLIAKTTQKLSQVLARGGGAALPGLVAERIDPGLGRRLVRQLPKGVILVTGTNGKTTTTKLLVAMLEAAGERVLTNRTGSNLKRGVLSALIASVNLRGHTRATMAVFEVDEASLRRVAPELQPRQIVVTNLFRDQLDRYGELDTTAALIGQGIAATSAHLYLNADDPLVASLAKYAVPERVTYFGIEGLPSASASALMTATDSDRCPQCGERLTFSRTFYGHIGHYHCAHCGLSRPQPKVAVTSVREAGLDGTRFTVSVEGHRHDLEWPLPGTYNLYNALAAIAVAAGSGLEVAVMAKTLAQTGAAFGRVEKVMVKGRTLYLLLIKNPAGFTQVLETFLMGQKAPVALMVVNDKFADGRDVSWLWDVPLEALARLQPRVWTAGIRGADMALRLHYAGVDAKAAPSLDQALEAVVAATPEGGRVFILPTYTAMLEVRQRLGRLVELEVVRA